MKSLADSGNHLSETIAIVKQEMLDFSQRRKMMLRCNFKLSASKRPCGVDRDYPFLIIIKCLVTKVKIEFSRICVFLESVSRKVFILRPGYSSIQAMLQRI